MKIENKYRLGERVVYWTYDNHEREGLINRVELKGVDIPERVEISVTYYIYCRRWDVTDIVDEGRILGRTGK